MITVEAEELYADERHQKDHRDRYVHAEPEWLKVLCGSVATRLIKVQRLLRLSTVRPSDNQAKPRTIGCWTARVIYVPGSTTPWPAMVSNPNAWISPFQNVC